jgi:hypothetical protein
MKLLLAMSLILNVLLLGAGVWRGTHQRPTELARPLRTQVASATHSSNLFKRQPRPATVKATPWKALESGDPKQFIAGLRAVGCPEQTIRDIVVTRVSREFQARLQTEHDEAARQRPWWRGTNATRQFLELSQYRYALRRERDDLLEEFFGEPAGRLAIQVTAIRGAAAVGREFLPAEKKAQLREIESRYRQMSGEVTYPASQALNEDEQRELLELQRRKRAELEALLTPQELEEFDLRESRAASYVLRQLPEAGSEVEFRLMVRAAQEAGANESNASLRSFPGRYGMEAPNELQQRREDEQRQAIETRVKELLGEQRFAQLQQAEAARQAAEQARREAE